MSSAGRYQLAGTGLALPRAIFMKTATISRMFTSIGPMMIFQCTYDAMTLAMTCPFCRRDATFALNTTAASRAPRTRSPRKIEFIKFRAINNRRAHTISQALYLISFANNYI